MYCRSSMTQQCFVMVLVMLGKVVSRATLLEILKRKCPRGSCEMQMAYIFQFCKLYQEGGIKPFPVNVSCRFVAHPIHWLGSLVPSGQRQAIFPSACIFSFTDNQHRDFLLPVNQ